MNPARINYKVYQGSSFEEVFLWESATKAYATINTITNSAPCVVTVNTGELTPPPHWRVRITGVSGLKEINLATEDSYYLSTTIASNQITINEINSANYGTYTSGGILAWNAPVPLVNLTAKMQIRENLDGALILELNTTNGGIVIDTAAHTIAVKMTSTQTTAFSFSTAIYSLELTNTLSNKVTTFLTGNLSLVREVTR